MQIRGVELILQVRAYSLETFGENILEWLVRVFGSLALRIGLVPQWRRVTTTVPPK